MLYTIATEITASQATLENKESVVRTPASDNPTELKDSGVSPTASNHPDDQCSGNMSGPHHGTEGS